jgi:hypothetical protein
MASVGPSGLGPATPGETGPHGEDRPPAPESSPPTSAAGNGGIVDLYRSVWRVAASAAARHRVAILIEIGLVVLWVVLRTRFAVETRPYIAWTLVACGIAAVSPTSGLVVLAATGPFYEPATFGRDLGPRHLLVAVLGASVVVRLLAGGWRRMPWSPPIVLALGIVGLTLLGVLNTIERFEPTFAAHAARSWLGSVGGAMIILVVAAWVARDGVRRPLAAALGAATVAGALSLLDHVDPGIVANGPFAWIGFWKDFNGRLGGAVPSPNGMAALLIVPAAVLVTWAFLDRGRLWPRVAALVLSAPLALALYVTYSRAALLALFVVAVVLSWRLRRALGFGVLVVGIVAGAILLPSYLKLRSESATEGRVTPGSVLVASDVVRFRAWGAARRMWEDEPIVGQGFLAYRQLGPDYGDPVLGSPHNEWLRLFAEEGTVAGIVGLGFVITTLIWLGRRRDPIATGLLAGTAGYFLMASFNNPLLFTQISAVAFTAMGFGLAWSVRRADPAPQLGVAASLEAPTV